MPISGLIVSLAPEDASRHQAIDAIESEPRIDVGVIESLRMSIVVDTKSSEEDKVVWNWLQDLPGVVFIDVAMVGFETPEHEPEETAEQPISNGCKTPD